MDNPGGSAASNAAIAAAAAARLPVAPPPVPQDVRQQEIKFQETRKAMIKVVNWQLNDDKHRKLDQILDTTQFLLKICGNVRDHPGEHKYRRIRITNPTFSRHVREAPGGEEFLHAAGWTVKVVEHEKYFAFDPQPGCLEWRVLEEACVELQKLEALVEGKLRRAHGDKKAEAERMRKEVRAALEEDKAHREVMFQPKTGPVEAQPLPESPRTRLAQQRQQMMQGMQQHPGAAGEDEEGDMPF